MLNVLGRVGSRPGSTRKRAGPRVPALSRSLAQELGSLGSSRRSELILQNLGKVQTNKIRGSPPARQLTTDLPCVT